VSTATPSAVLLGGESNPTISVARALAQAGISVHALGSGDWEPVRHSRACSEYVRIDGEDIQAGWFAWLEHSAERLEGAVVLPCGDNGVELIARRRAELAALGYGAFEADDEVMLAMLDKNETYALARRAGIPTPRTFTLAGTESQAAAISELGFPFALKPNQSHVFSRAGGRGKAFVIHDRAQFDLLFDELTKKGVSMLATEIVPGGADHLMSYYSYIDREGKPLFHFTKQKLRQFPTLFGTETYGITRWNPELAEVGMRFFSSIGLRGLAAVEFKRDGRDGKLKLIECNHRFTGSHELVRAAGIDIALLAYQRALGRDGPPVASYGDDVRLWYPIRDAHAFLSMRRNKQISTSDWIRTLLHRQHFPVFKLSDPKPTIVDLYKRTHLALSRGPAARERRQPQFRSV
jgi:D-aspartate ligase